MFATPTARFRAVAIAEAFSWAGLLVGMFFKYVMVFNDLGVKIFGPVHGVIFVLYLFVVLMVREPLNWDGRTTTWALIASVPPFGTIVFERWVNKRTAAAVTP
ncbi:MULTISPECIES: DUF3817 domain-containing protein [unclassified Crossiella]|uniref:DUF3817 domain-containing protein n=1 Tax=unclassified Crossiella TaxID=2620835 RepID=UPI00207C9062|nr:MULTISPECIES: DUF3817 domain-containing protein [unclassified Crossiella]MCO1579907.1 DUF3817 domain-containing protein [Crossiella sp. SN42]WHT18234.1 DUF3817 domain-containing protein [Crossiella sp. CA-258035]